MSSEDALKARLQAYEHRESQWKQQLEKAQLEHTQVLNLQQKLTQAGTHLKTLATDNAHLQQQLKEHTSLSGETEKRLKSERDLLAAQLEQQQRTSHSTIELLLQNLTINDNNNDDSTPSSLPDVFDQQQVKQYIEQWVSNSSKQSREKDTIISTLRSEIGQLQAKLEEMVKSTRVSSPVLPVSSISTQTSPSASSNEHISVDYLEQNIKGLINDTESYSIDANSIPPQLLATLEHLRTHLQTLVDTQQANALQTADESKELKRQITQLQMNVNELSEEKEQWLSDKEDLETQLENNRGKDHDIQLKLEQATKENRQHQEQLDQLRLDHRLLLDKTKEYEEKLASSSIASTSATAEVQKYQEELAKAQAERQSLLDKIKELEEKLGTSEKARQQSQEQVERLQQEHQALLDKISHIKDTLAPRLEADKQLRVKVTELTAELDQTKQHLEEMRSTMVARDEESSRQLENKERHLYQLQVRFEKLQAEKEELDISTMQLDARCHQLEDQKSAVMAELDRIKKQMADELHSSASERASLENLQSVLEEFQTIKDAEIRAAVEHIERQLEVAKKSWMEYEERARLAETALEQYQHDEAKTPQYEREIKEKNLLIGKLRHEAIILNEHLVEAMRRLKEESNESNVDRQLITNLIVGFFSAPRGDRKRFDILTIIASVLQLTDEQKEQVGLIRMKNNNGQQSNSPASNTGWQSPRQQQDTEPKESFTDAWISFLLKESNKRKPNAPSSPSPSSPPSDQHDI
ncbi:uncharacterized protein BX664DRAFT_82426 [Halteromyces radiatus]|uniref:uncharacterized protein n=1 Tax=Halteromyces radiatus TaxID=101107 RepID=UPI0022207E98|nr:uncharacterized protein BX664DRAFT_82426 [Halteromyces radiatus]KAI8097576.1 hypothetical protein BX664DRAFT_82426 [Halteromyces radiatus]